MNRWSFSLLPAMAVVALASPGNGQDRQDAFQRVPVIVTGANGPLLTVNRGTQSGIRERDTVVFRRAGQRPLVGVVRSATARESRIELEDLEQGVLVSVGMRGEVLVPGGRVVPDGTQTKTPEHPPWEEPVGLWAEGKPLLAPVSSPSPEERPSDLYGRFYTRYQATDDSIRNREYSRWWSGVDFQWRNPFEQGGSFQFRGDVSYRNDSSGNRDGQDGLSRVQRMSYTLGESPDDARRLQVGRFLPSIFPQFRLLDGVEYVARLEGGTQVGASVGYLPGYRDDLAATDDFSAAMFCRWVDSPEELLALSAGYQKTWHGGRQDRDLLAGNLQWVLTPSTTLRGSALADYYDGSAQLKSQGVQLTELHCSVDHRFGNAGGASLYTSYFDWPELLRDEFPDPPAATISDQKVTRGGISGWANLSRNVNLYGRFDTWRDTVNSGTFGDMRLALRDLLYEQSELSLGIYDTRGTFSGGLGARIRHTHWSGATTVRLGYETVRFKQDGFLGAQSDLLQHILQLDLDTRLARDLDLSAEALQRFGDEQDSLTLGLRLTWRF